MSNTIIRKLAAHLAEAIAHDPTEARRQFTAYSVANGGGRTPYYLTAQEDSTKLSHNGSETKYRQSVCYLAPANLASGDGLRLNVCPNSTPQCRKGCLWTAGRLGMAPAQRAMVIRTRFLMEHPAAAMAVIFDDIRKHRNVATKAGAIMVLRLNGTSDIAWEQIPGLAEHLQSIGVDRCQDYTKRPNAVASPFWHFTRSATERTMPTDVVDGMAIVVDIDRGQPLPVTFWNRPVIDGDHDHGDLRILDAERNPTAVVLLRRKGNLRNAPTGPRQMVKSTR